MTPVAVNLAAVQARIAAAAARAGRDPSSIRLLPISKTVPAERLREAIAGGVTDFGENRVQEAAAKAGLLGTSLSDPAAPRWVIVGHLQTNKAKLAVSFADEFQALDSLRLAAALDRALAATGRSLRVFVQVNTSGENTKFGLEPATLAPFLKELRAFDTLQPVGLMTLAAFTPDPERVRACFRLLRALGADFADAYSRPPELSMGMSGDFDAAIEEGATVVRVGQAIFGARPTNDAAYWPGLVPG